MLRLVRFGFLAGRLAVDKLLKTLGAYPPVRLVPVADTIIGIVTLAKPPPANLAVVVAPSILNKIDLVWIKLLPAILADRAALLVDERCGWLPRLATPGLGEAPLHRVRNVLRLPRGAVNQDGGIIAGC